MTTLTPADWGARYASHYYNNPGIGTVSRLVVHHTATSYPSASSYNAFLQNLESYGHSRDGADIEYHALVANGVVAQGFQPGIRGCHCIAKQPNGQSYNDNSLGFAFIGYYYGDANHPTPDPYRQADLDAFVNWVVAHIQYGYMTQDVLRRASGNGQPGWFAHNDVDSTACPGTIENVIQTCMDQASAMLGGSMPPPIVTPPPVTTPPPSSKPPFPFPNGHYISKSSPDNSCHSGFYWPADRPGIATMQGLLGGLEQDGLCGDMTYSKIREFQSRNGLAVDGMCGELTWAKL